MKKLQTLFLSAPLFAEVSEQTETTNTESPLGLTVSVGLLVLLIVLAFYTKKNKKDDEEENERDTSQGETVVQKEVMPERTQHYKFAHEVLRDLFFENKDKLFQDILYSEEGLRGLWYRVGEFYIENFEGPKLLDSSGLTIEWKESENHSLFIITLPKPEKSPEAYFVGMVVPHNSSDKARYITLEYGMDVMNQPYTVLCGWDGKTHLNYAEGDEPTVEAFTNTLVSMLKKE